MSCPDCFSGEPRRDGVEPQGRMMKLHGLDTYVAGPSADSHNARRQGALVIIPDAMGIDFVNNKLLADAYASKGGYTVYLPDFMRGQSPWERGSPGHHRLVQTDDVGPSV